MPYPVRHAHAGNKRAWAGPDSARPLSIAGRQEAHGLLTRLRDYPISRILSSPSVRCLQTVEPLAKDRALVPVSEPELAEVDYGQWTGGSLKTLAKEPLWKVVQAHPSAAVFPDGEGLAGMQARAVATVRRHDARIAEAHGPHAVWLACSHGDVIKAVLADALATHLDNFQRIMVDTCSISVIHYTPTRPFVARVNDLGGDVAGLVPPKPRRRRKAAPRSSDAVVGGST